MDTKDPKTWMIGGIVVVVVLLAGIFIWNQAQALGPNAVYRNTKSPDESRKAAQESQQKYRMPMDRFHQMKRAGSEGNTAGAP